MTHHEGNQHRHRQHQHRENHLSEPMKADFLSAEFSASEIDARELNARLSAAERAKWARDSKSHREADAAERAGSSRPDEFPAVKNDFRSIAGNPPRIHRAPRIARPEQPVHVEDNPTQPDIPVYKGISPERLAELNAAPRYTAESGYADKKTEKIDVSEYVQSEQFHIPEMTDEQEEPVAEEPKPSEESLSSADRAEMAFQTVSRRLDYASRMLRSFDSGQNEALGQVLTTIDAIRARLAKGPVDIGAELQRSDAMSAMSHSVKAENNKEETLAEVLNVMHEASEDSLISQTDRNVFRNVRQDLASSFKESSDWSKLDESMREIHGAGQFGVKDLEDERIRAAADSRLGEAKQIIEDIQANRTVKRDALNKLFDQTKSDLKNTIII